MKKFIIISILTSSIVSYSQKITRGPDIGEIYFLGPTHTGTGLYYSTDFGETAVCVDSIKDFISVAADKTNDGIYCQTMPVNLYYSEDNGYQNTWVFKQGEISEDINSGISEGNIYNHITSHSENFGSNFISHSLDGYFGNLLESEIDCEFPFGYAIVYKSSVTDSIYLLLTQDNYESIGLQNSFYVNNYSKVDITRGVNSGEIYLNIAQDSFLENLVFVSIDYGQTFDRIESYNLANFYQLDIEGGRQEGEIYILYNFVNQAFLNAHSYIFHSADYGKTFEVYHPFKKGNEPVLANFSTLENETQLMNPVEFSNFSIGDIQYFQWDFDNDGIIDSYEESPSYVYQDTGWYSVKLSVVGTDSINSFVKENYIHIIDTITSSPDLYYQEISIFPNPFNDKISIEIRQEYKMIEIYDLNGKNHFSKTLTQENKTEILDLRKLEKGIYILKIKTERQDLIKKIITI